VYVPFKVNFAFLNKKKGRYRPIQKISAVR